MIKKFYFQKKQAERNGIKLTFRVFVFSRGVLSENGNFEM